MTDKTYSITELKTFIDAVEFAADVEEWIPSARQWRRIREMINGLAPEPVAAPVRQPNPVQFHQPQMHVPQMPPNNFPAMPSGPSPLGGIAPQQMGAPNAPLASGNSQIPIRTPDIDTSNGSSYKSAFA